MYKLYQISLGTTLDRDKVKNLFDNDSRVQNWFYAGLPFVLFIKTTMNAQDISMIIEAQLGQATHLVCEITSDYWGRIDANLWTNFPSSQHKRKTTN